MDYLFYLLYKIAPGHERDIDLTFWPVVLSAGLASILCFLAWTCRWLGRHSAIKKEKEVTKLKLRDLLISWGYRARKKIPEDLLERSRMAIGGAVFMIGLAVIFLSVVMQAVGRNMSKLEIALLSYIGLPVLLLAYVLLFVWVCEKLEHRKAAKEKTMNKKDKKAKAVVTILRRSQKLSLILYTVGVILIFWGLFGNLQYFNERETGYMLIIGFLFISISIFTKR